MPNRVLVSVIMSVYNGENVVKDAIESILDQTYHNFEFIIIDDGSSDDSLNILKVYQAQDERIKIISHKNMGLTKSLNVAVENSKGKYIARQDADDVSLKERLEKQVSFLEEHKDIALLGTNQFEVNGEDEHVGRYYDDDKINSIVYLVNPFAHTSVMFRKEEFIKLGKYDESFTTSQDFEAWMRVSGAGKISMLKEPLVKRYVGDDSISAKKKFRQIRDAARARFMHASHHGYLKAFYYTAYQFLAAYMPKPVIKMLRVILGK